MKRIQIFVNKSSSYNQQIHAAIHFVNVWRGAHEHKADSKQKSEDQENPKSKTQY